MVSFLEVATTFPYNIAQGREYTKSIESFALYYSLAYVVVIFAVKAVMANAKPFDLQKPLNLWNAGLAIFSTLGAIFTGFGLLAEIVNNGFTASYLYIGQYDQGWAGYWTWLFVLSKMVEFGDTIFIVLRKKPLMFLHWYHHALTLNYAVISYKYDLGFNHWIAWMNFSVHSIMYGYYMLRSMGIKVPAWVAQNLTTIQIVQFIITHFILFHVGYLASTGVKVDSNASMFWFCLLMEISYVVLFGNFYYQSYIKGGGKKYNAEKKVDKKE